MSELSARSGISPGTIKHYLREGVLGPSDGIVRTSRNMAYYPPDFVDRLRSSSGCRRTASCRCG